MMVFWKKVIDNIGIFFVFKGYRKKEVREYVVKYLDIFGFEGFEYKYLF